VYAAGLTRSPFDRLVISGCPFDELKAGRWLPLMVSLSNHEQTASKPSQPVLN
jgi:hypothetical protein